MAGDSLSTSTLEILNGEMLGDGHLRINGKNARFEHGTASLEYARYVASTLQEITPSEIKPYTGQIKADGNPREHYRWTSATIPPLTEIRSKWYGSSDIKAIPEDLKLTPLVCMHWYLGDGSLSEVKQANSEPSQQMRISTDSFTGSEHEMLVALLADIGVEARIHKHVSESDLLNLYIRSESMREFLRYIGECPVSCYEHKWSIDPYYEIYDYPYTSLDIDNMLGLPRATVTNWIRSKWFAEAEIDYIKRRSRVRFSERGLSQLLEARRRFELTH